MNQGFDLQRYILPLQLAFKNPHKIQRYVLANKKGFSNWGLLLAAIVLAYFAFSDGLFSFYYTISAAIQAFGFVIIALKVYTSRTVNGLSLNTFICYSVSLFVKFCSNMFYEGYLPSDSSGDVIFRLFILIAFIASLYMTYMISERFRRSYNQAIDSIHYLNLIVPALVLACFVHPTLNDRYAGDISWTFAFYLEGLAMLPQLYMLSKEGGEVEVFTSHFVASQGFSLCISTVFWLGCYHEMNEFVGKSWTLFAGKTGYVVLLFHVVQIILFSDFLYEYVKSMRRGLPMIIPV